MYQFAAWTIAVSAAVSELKKSGLKRRELSQRQAPKFAYNVAPVLGQKLYRREDRNIRQTMIMVEEKLSC